MNLIGKELKRWREAAGLSQDDLAAELNRSRSCISKFENDRKTIDIYTLKNWALVTNSEIQAAVVLFGADIFANAVQFMPLMPMFIQTLTVAQFLN